MLFSNSTVEAGALTVSALAGAIAGWCAQRLSNWLSQKTDFDHRLRLEKEYQRYDDLWTNFFELHRSLHQAVDVIGNTNEVRHDYNIVAFFNAYQQSVQRGEPFMSQAVYDAARPAVAVAHRIMNNLGDMAHFDGLPDCRKEEEADHALALDDENEVQIQELDGLRDKLVAAIRRRVGPP